MTEPILQVKDLSVYYNKKKALNSVSLDFMPNEITALIGPSGSGKSTLLKAINRMGDLNPEVTTTGTVIYNGHNIYSPRTDTVELRKEIGMVFQQPNPFPMTIYENVVYGLRINGVKDKQVLDEAVERSLYTWFACISRVILPCTPRNLVLRPLIVSVQSPLPTSVMIGFAFTLPRPLIVAPLESVSVLRPCL